MYRNSELAQLFKIWTIKWTKVHGRQYIPEESTLLLQNNLQKRNCSGASLSKSVFNVKSF